MPFAVSVRSARAGTDVQPAKAPLAADQRHALHDLGAEHLDGAADLHLPVIGGDDEHGPRREHVEHVTDEAVGRTQLVVVVLTEPLGVGDLVDALVVGVHKGLPAVANSRTAVTSPAGVCQRWRST